METLNCSKKGLKDSDLEQRLNSLSGDVCYTEVDLSGNKLECVPNLGKQPAFRELKYLKLKGNRIMDINPENITHTTEVLDLSRNRLSQVCDFSQHDQLQELNLSHNKIASIDLENLPCNIQVVKMYNNRISDMCNFRQHQHLRELNLSSNQITSIDPENLPCNIQVVKMWKNKICDMCNFSQHQHLRELDLSNNQITSIDPENLPCNIQVVKMAGNSISDMCNFSQHQHLRELDLSNNQITSIDPENLPCNIQVVKMAGNSISDMCNFSQHQHLRELDLSNNLITSIDQENLPCNIQVVEMSWNQISDMCNFSKHQHLRELNLSSNLITSIDPENLPCNIQVVKMCGNSISDMYNFGQHQHLRELDLSNNQITSIDPENLPCNIQVVKMAGNSISVMCNFSQHQHLRELDLSDNHITSINPENLPCNIQVVKMSENSISVMCNFSQHQHLRELDLSNNQITSINPENLPCNIQVVKMWKNSISDTCNFSQHKHLRELDLSSNLITSIDPENLPCNIQVVKMCGNSISDMCNFSQHQHLRELDLSSNLITSIDPENLPCNIQVVNMSGNSISDMCNFSQQQHLRELDLSWNQITSIEPENLPCNIQVVKMCGNSISDMCNFSQHQHLRELHLSSNLITSIDPENLPCNIQVVNMSGNSIGDMCNFSQHQHLRELDLSNNLITSIDQENLPCNIQVVEMSWNQISDMCNFSKHQHLRELDLSSNLITSIDPENLPCNIQVVKMCGNSISDMYNFGQHQHLRELDLSNNQITSIDPENLPCNIQVVKMAGNSISVMCNFSQHQHLRELDLSDNHITSINPENLPCNIQVVKMSENSISVMCNFSQHQHLRELDLSNNQITSINPENLPCNIQVVKMWKNSISDTCNFSQHKHLRELDLSSNLITSIDPENLPCNIQVVKMCGNSISDMCNFNQHQHLRELDLSSNLITSIDPENLPCNIQVVNMSGNSISDMCNFSQQQHLRELDLSWNQITSIEPENLPCNIQVVKMCGNSISDMCNFSQHQHLRELHLSSNLITNIDPENLPCNIQVVNMSGNSIGDMCNFSQYQHLRELDLSWNQITSIDPENLPCNIQVVNMSGNSISDICNFSQYQHLRELDLSNNKITSINPPNYIFPYSLETLNMHNKTITMLGEKLFETQHFCTCTIGDFNSLIQPPTEIYINGYDAIRSYYTDVRLSKMVQNSRKRLVLLGLTEAGKSSAVESLKQGKAVLVNIRDRTQVIDIKHWDITEEDIIHIYDQGGHSIYNITSPMFISKESTVFLVHDITKVHQQEIDRSIEILRQALHQYPNNELHVVLTHTDLLSSDQMTTNADGIREAIEQFLDGEIHSNGKLKEDQKNEELRASTSQLVEMFQQKKTSILYFPVSSQNYAGMEKVKDFLKEIIKKKRDPVPDSWVQFYRRITESSKNFLSLGEVVDFYVNQLSNEAESNSDESVRETPKARALVALNYFRDTNLVLHYDQNPLLRHYVFHDLEFIIAVFKSVFHHSISDVINYEKDEKLQAKFKNLECDTAVKQYQNEGLLREKLLSCLWEQHGLSVQDRETFIELMRSFNLCYNISKDNSLLYFPWFVKSQKCPDHLRKECLMVFDQDHASVQLQCEFFNRIPLNVFEMVCVCLQRKATKESHYMGDRQAWKDGLVVYFGSVECIVTRSVENKSIINICVRGSLDDIPQIWKTIDTLLEELQSVLSQWHGIIKSIHFICGHCVIEGILPHHWPLDQVFPKNGKLVPCWVHCNKDLSRHIPVALVAAISKEADSKQKRAVDDVKDYLRAFWKPKDPPGPLSYLDCDVQPPDVYTLNWGRPHDSGGDIITNFVVESRDEADDWKQVQDQITGNSFTFKGHAFEFRVAAENRIGQGPFINCEPAMGISDEKLSDSDMAEMKQNKEAFLQMSSVGKVTIRLGCRGGIHTNVGEKVQWALNLENGAFTAASRLMEEVYRCNYQQLYLFKKTLAEFGQHHLADLVPVRKENDPHFDHPVVQSLLPSSSLNERESQSGINKMQSPGISSTNLPSEVVEDMEHTTHPPVNSPRSSEPQPVPDDIQTNISEDFQVDNTEHTTHPPAKRPRSSEPQPITEDFQPSISEEFRGEGIDHTTHPPAKIPRSSEPQPVPDDIQPSVSEGNLLNELTHEQKASRPQQRLFGTISYGVRSVHAFGINLGFKQRQVKKFQSDNPLSVQDQVIEMLHAWRKNKKAPATVARLIKALQKSKIPEQNYRQDVLDYFNGSDEDTDTEDCSED